MFDWMSDDCNLLTYNFFCFLKWCGSSWFSFHTFIGCRHPSSMDSCLLINDVLHSTHMKFAWYGSCSGRFCFGGGKLTILPDYFATYCWRIRPDGNLCLGWFYPWECRWCMRNYFLWMGWVVILLLDICHPLFVSMVLGHRSELLFLSWFQNFRHCVSQFLQWRLWWYMDGVLCPSWGQFEEIDCWNGSIPTWLCRH